MEVKHKGLLTKMSRGRSNARAGNWKERYFELRLSKAAHSYALQYSKGPGKKAKGEIRIDETSKLDTSTRVHSGFQCLVLTNETDELHFHAKTQKEQKDWEASLNKAINDTCKSAKQRESINRHLQQKDQMMGSMDALRDAHRRQQQYIHVLEQENNDLNEMLQSKERAAAGVGGVVSGGLKEQLATKITENAKLNAEVSRLKRLVERLTAAVEAAKKKDKGGGAAAAATASATSTSSSAPKSTPDNTAGGMVASYVIKKPTGATRVEESDDDDSDSSDDWGDGPPPPPPSP